MNLGASTAPMLEGSQKINIVHSNSKQSLFMFSNLFLHLSQEWVENWLKTYYCSTPSRFVGTYRNRGGRRVISWANHSTSHCFCRLFQAGWPPHHWAAKGPQRPHSLLLIGQGLPFLWPCLLPLIGRKGCPLCGPAPAADWWRRAGPNKKQPSWPISSRGRRGWPPSWLSLLCWWLHPPSPHGLRGQAAEATGSHWGARILLLVFFSWQFFTKSWKLLFFMVSTKIANHNLSRSLLIHQFNEWMKPGTNTCLYSYFFFHLRHTDLINN